jgi:hypothetical protein
MESTAASILAFKLSASEVTGCCVNTGPLANMSAKGNKNAPLWGGRKGLISCRRSLAEGLLAIGIFQDNRRSAASATAVPPGATAMPMASLRKPSDTHVTSTAGLLWCNRCYGRFNRDT